MRSITATTLIVLIILAYSTVNARQYEYSVGPMTGLSTLSGSEELFPLSSSYGGQVFYHFDRQYSFWLEVSQHEIYNDTTADSWSSVADQDHATLRWKSTRLGLSLRRYLFSRAGWFNLNLDLGAGLMLWKMYDRPNDTIVVVVGPDIAPNYMEATELFFSGGGGISTRFSDRITAELGVAADYLTSGGTDFPNNVNDSRNRWVYQGAFRLNFSFGSGPDKIQPRPSTPVFIRAQSAVAAKLKQDYDSDGDGVIDARDDCPATDPRARGMIDIHGCPVDSDLDGLLDYLDTCPHNDPGASTDSTGCPIDSDEDGIPDGLDDCPGTLPGVDVDQNGCIDLEVLSRPMVFHINYEPGSVAIDRASTERFARLARMLAIASEIRLEVAGYTDNVGTANANRGVSKTRADVVRDYLIRMGVEPLRITSVGKGEVDFIASNDTADGRKRNRRVVITFFK